MWVARSRGGRGLFYGCNSKPLLNSKVSARRRNMDRKQLSTIQLQSFCPLLFPPQEKTNKHTSAAVNQGPLRSAALSLSYYYRIIATMLPNSVLHLVCVCRYTHTLGPNCLHQGGHAFAGINLSVYLTVSKITPNVINRFNCNFSEMLQMGQE